ncbi:hypothetical protein [Methylobacterium segetis]|uniref:hypothetical protein n=1 Tax=Methylobacterium segetis TaxID=2488750 RepID=UPI001052DF56|nr:hypothetical protein [Methylobacterium segetis]
MSDATMTVTLDGRRLVSFTDTERPYREGRVDFYTEDAKVAFDNVEGSVTDDFESDAPQTLADGSSVGTRWDTVCLGYGTGAVTNRLDF